MSQPFILVGWNDEGMRIRQEIKLHWNAATTYDVEGSRFKVFDLKNEQCGLSLVHFCGIIVEESANGRLDDEVTAFKDRQTFDLCHASIAVLA